MRIVILYRPNSEHGRTVESYVQDYRNRHAGGKLDLLDIDTRDGGATASLYDVMQYPTILALGNDGSVLQMWEGGTLPLMDDLAYYTFSSDTVAP